MRQAIAVVLGLAVIFAVALATGVGNPPAIVDQSSQPGASAGATGAGLLAVSSGLIGALLVFMLGVLREAWRNEQERRGILRLLLAEINHNDAVLEVVLEGHPDVATYHEMSAALSVETWRGVRDRTSLLTRAGLLDSLLTYYEHLETLMSGIASAQHMDAFYRAGHDPHETLDFVGVTQHETRRAITSYLDRPRWRLW